MSLRIRVLLIVLAINALLFASAGWFLAGVQARENDRTERALSSDLLYTLARSIRSQTSVHAAALLEWPSWAAFDDAYLVQNEWDFSGGESAPVPKGVGINPLGRLDRPADFDEAAVHRALYRAIQSEAEVADVGSGRVVPIPGPQGTWGACWYRRAPLDRAGLFVTLVEWFLVSTLLLTAGTFLALNVLVLQPVQDLARGARRVRAGDLGVRLAPPARRDEMAELVRIFNAMAAEVQGFNERLVREVEDATEKARRAEQAAMTQRRLAAMGELAAGIAHEINNPLGGLQNAVARLRAGGLSPAREAEYLGLLERGLERIGRTVRQLLRFTPRAHEPLPVDLGLVAEDAVDLVRHRAEREGVELVLAVDAGTPLVQGEGNELGQALLNLLVNALDALAEGGTRDPRGPRIELAVRPGGPGEVLVRVHDDGPGVAPEELRRLFDLFYSTKEVGRGTGLGLALVHNAVLAHGGTIELASEPGGGFTAEIRLPAHQGSPGGER